MSRSQKRAVLTAVEVENPITSTEIDAALAYADAEYAEELNVDMLRILFNTIQSQRELGIKLELLVDNIMRLNVLESRNKRIAYKGAIMKAYNQRNQVKLAANKEKEAMGLSVAPAVKQTQHPVDFLDGEQRILF
ncbi:MAG: hypothetical protein P4L81_04410 [Candidatus Pacebacteria bacterium]|nr:hypothetical protein [Candidatus Paceibacterota bacterium]